MDKKSGKNKKEKKKERKDKQQDKQQDKQHSEEREFTFQPKRELSEDVRQKTKEYNIKLDQVMNELLHCTLFFSNKMTLKLKKKNLYFSSK